MAIKDIASRCWILALFIRDDGQRLLLGDGHYEFKDSQQHFSANTFENDTAEVQGNDGVLLAGQVRRPSVQSFDGYIGDGTLNKQQIEQIRRDFFMFFRKNYYYTVVYIFPDGSAIQRKNGFIEDAPEVKEIWQIHPQFHVGLLFEDVNYYAYDEDEDGGEIYGRKATIHPLGEKQGGLVWDDTGAVISPFTLGYTPISGKFLSIDDAIAGAPIRTPAILGDATQNGTPTPDAPVPIQTVTGENVVRVTGKNILDPSNGWTNQTISVNGVTVNNADTALSGYIPVVAGQSYTFSQTQLTNIDYLPNIVSFFDAAKNFIGRFQVLQLTPQTFTAPANSAFIRFGYYNANGLDASNLWNLIANAQLEQGTVVTDFEPYQGRSYPISLGEIPGKNLLPVEPLALSYGVSTTYNPETGQIHIEGTPTQQWVSITPYMDTSILSGTTLTLSSDRPAGLFGVTCRIRNSSNASTDDITIGVDASSPTTKTTTNDDDRLQIWLNFGTNYQGKTVDNIFTIQLEASSQATAFEPYREASGVEPIHLNKIGDYQDRIYKADDGWHLRKETTKVILDASSDESWIRSGQSTSSVFVGALSNAASILPLTTESGGNGALCSCLTYNTSTAANTWRWNDDSGADGTFKFLLFRRSSSEVADLDAFKSWLASNPVEVYYALATPTDTLIANPDLIAQLDALADLRTWGGPNIIMTQTSNLTPTLEFEYANSTDWNSAGYIWEEGAGGESGNITVDSIDTVYPVWVITGASNNPTLTNTTTGTSLSYAGNVTESQTLVIDMRDRTATLNGTSVLKNVTGDWVSFAPGMNRVSYSTSNADAPASTIEWQEIVG